MAEETTAKSAEKVYTLEDIKFNEVNKTMAILGCIPIVGLVLLITEKDDKFVRYMSAQFVIAALVSIALSFLVVIPVLGLLIGIASFFYGITIFVMMIMAMVKVSNGERYDLPVISEYALKLMAKI